MADIKPLRALGISGSPRRHGNTETLIDQVLRGAEQAGAAVDKVILSALDIAPCDACGACEPGGECVHDDDMPALFDRMGGSQVWVLGTPVYWWGPTAQLKTFLDRWYGRMFRPEDKALFRGRQVVAVIPMGDTDPRIARHTVGTLEDSLAYVRAELVATVLAPGVNDPGEVSRHAEVMDAARRAGAEAVERCLAGRGRSPGG